jgi:hypothetical protein
MGGLLADCGCYDGPYEPGDSRLISVRCRAHMTTPPLDGYLLLFKMTNREGKEVLVAPRTPPKRPTMAIPGGKRRRKR